MAAREAARERRRRSAPVRWGTLGVLAVTWLVLGIVDANHGVAIPAYFWAVNAVVVAGLIVGAVLRRPIWWMALLLIPAAVGTFVFSGTRVSLHDGSGDNTYAPQRISDLQANYRHAFGRTTIDLTELPRLTASRTIHVDQAAGQVRLVVPPSLPVDVHANVHLGAITIDGRDDSSGMGLDNDPVTTASNQALTVDVRISAGQLVIDHSG